MLFAGPSLNYFDRKQTFQTCSIVLVPRKEGWFSFTSGPCAVRRGARSWMTKGGEAESEIKIPYNNIRVKVSIIREQLSKSSVWEYPVAAFWGSLENSSDLSWRISKKSQYEYQTFKCDKGVNHSILQSRPWKYLFYGEISFDKQHRTLQTT